MAKKKNHYVDNERFLEDIKEYKKKCKIALDEGKEKPKLSEYIGQCIYLIAENLAHKPRFMNYSFVDEMKSDAIENCLMYFDNFDSDKYNNPFAYFTQIIYYAFLRRIGKEEKNRYTLYKNFQHVIVNSYDTSLLTDNDDKHLLSGQLYDNINVFMEKFEKKEQDRKEKRKTVKEGLAKFYGE
mgnify:CR=1 FL=1